MKQKQSRRYFTGIDGLRALAVIGVILYHINPNQFIGGYLGVLIFFVLSGYFITGHIIKRVKLNQFSFKEFYIKRIKRIYPQLISVLALTSTYILLFQRQLLHNLYQIVLTNLLGVYNFWQILNGQSYFERFAQDESPFIHLWTLSIEWQYYLIWPIVLVILFKLFKKISYVASFTVVIAALSAGLMAFLYHPGIDTSRIYYGTDTRLFALMIGSLLAMIWPSEKLSKNVYLSVKWLINLFGAVALVVLCWMSIWSEMNPQNGVPYLWGMLVFSLISAVLVAIIIHPASSFNRLLTNPIFSYLGSRSYGIYLYQFPVMIFFETTFKNTAHHPRLVPVVEVILILLISEVSHQLIEKHAHNFSLSYLKSRLSNFSQMKWYGQLKWSIFSAIILAFIVSVGVSPFAKEQVNPNPLEQAVTDNVKENKKHNARILAQNNRLNNGDAENDYLVAKQQAENKPVSIDSSYQELGLTASELQQLNYLSATAIGDSVMAGSSNGLRAILPNMTIDAAISRQMVEGYDILKKYKEEGNLSPIIVMGLGTNGPFSFDDLEKVMELVGKDSHLFWINVHVPNRPWETNVNQTIAEFASTHSSDFTVIDWHDYSNTHPDWFIDDLTHLNPLGNGPKYYGSYIAKIILQTMANQKQ